MNCSKCGEEMNVKKIDVSYNNPEAINKYYKRTTYHCKNDDVWITVEEPTKKDSIA